MMGLKDCINSSEELKEYLKKKANKCFSVPLLAYVTIFVIVILLIIIENFIRSSKIICDIVINILPSLLVSIFIDFVTTRKRIKQEEFLYERMMSDLESECSELASIMYISVYEAHGINGNNKYTFEEWTEKLLTIEDKNQEKQINEIKYMISQITKIKRTARELRDVFKLSMDNVFVTEELCNNIKSIINLCIRIERECEREQFEGCQRIIIKELIPKIKNTFKNISNDFERKYNEEEYF